MTTLMFPVGHSLGTYYFGTGADDHVQQVRLGREIVELSDHEFAVWSVAHGLAEVPAPGTGGWNRAMVEFALRGGEIGDAAAIVDRLLGRSLLAEVDVDGPAAADFGRRHRLLPLHLGQGNSAELRTMFTAGTTSRPMVGMTRTLYEVWLWSHLSPNLLAACEARKDPEPIRLLAAVLAALHTLLGPSAACLDLAMEEYEA